MNTSVRVFERLIHPQWRIRLDNELSPPSHGNFQGLRAMENLRIRAWYVSTQRLLELLPESTLPAAYEALKAPDTQGSRVFLANSLGATLLPFLRKASVEPLNVLAARGDLKPGTSFTYDGHFYGKGFGFSNKYPQVSLSEKLDDILQGKRLVLNFSK